MMSEKKIGFDKAVLDDKIITDDDNVLTIGSVIASELVQEYDDGFAYKPAKELETMSRYAGLVGSVPVKTLSHPTVDTNYLLLKHDDVQGVASNFKFVKNLKDPRTGRPMRRGVRADVSWFKSLVDPKILDDLRSFKMRDNSIGFTFDKDPTSGRFNGADYDYIQRNIYLNHIAAPIPKGRCPGPICGIGYDANVKYGLDEAQLNSCPVCRRITEVGFLKAGKRMMKQYGPDVLEVIEGNPLPEPLPVADSVTIKVDGIDPSFNKAFSKLLRNLEQS